MLYGALSLWIALKFWARYDPDPALHTVDHPAQTPMTDGQFNVWALALGVACGLAISVKWYDSVLFSVAHVLRDEAGVLCLTVNPARTRVAPQDCHGDASNDRA